MSADPYSAFLPVVLRRDGSREQLAIPLSLPSDDLFGSVEPIVRAGLREVPSRSEGPATGRAAFVVRPGLAISLDLDSVRPSHVQCLLSLLAHRGLPSGDGELESHVLDPACGLTLWSGAGPAVAEEIASAWRKLTQFGRVDSLVALTTPWLYGNKLRLIGFLAPVFDVSLPAGAPVLDLMAGTGIVARALSERLAVSTNDPNPYAALLSRCQKAGEHALDALVLTNALKVEYALNRDRLEKLIGDRLEEEAEFLHTEPNEEAIALYSDFTSTQILPVTDGQGSSAARLVTERYANVYFGLAQAIEIDSLRIAIERAFPTPGLERDLCLCALTIACTTCATGPHFAQPPRARTLKAFRTIIERRARSVAWEFDLALGRLAARRPPAVPMGPTTQLNWRDALTSFVARTGSRPAGVYIDPPYSKLQYSRYYHVLNVLLAYNYPAVEGIGRYPPRSHRFSSPFEYQPRVALRELGELIRACAEHGLTTLLSYGEGGFASIDALAGEMAGVFARTELFSEGLRHHSQGRRLNGSRGATVEYLLVGYPPSYQP